MDPDNFKSDFPSKHLESADLGGPGGRTVVLTIVAVKGEPVDEKPKQVMTFEPQAGIEKTTWMYGITVARCLAAMFGDKKSGWIGKRVGVRSETVEAFGEMKPGLRPFGSPDIEKNVSFTVPKGRGKVAMVMKRMVSKGQQPTDPAPQP